jgi:hypothetical protein
MKLLRVSASSVVDFDLSFIVVLLSTPDRPDAKASFKRALRVSALLNTVVPGETDGRDPFLYLQW